MRARIRSAVASSLVCFVIAIAGRASADDKPTLSGQWSASAMTETWAVSEWGAACGPKPTGQGAPGGSVQIQQQGGELSISGAGRAYATTQCWEQMPGVSRTSHSGGSRGWRTRCASAPNDPRRATITTSLAATDSSIQMTEIGEYAFTIQDTQCRATVSRSRVFTLVRRDGETPPAPSAPTSTAAPPPAPTAAPPPAPTAVDATPKPSSKCSGSAGDPARLEVRPGRKVLRAGDRFAFRAVVTDAEGCVTGTAPSWSIKPGPLAAKASVDATGAIAVAGDAGEGLIEIAVSVGAKGATVVVEVARADRYEAMLGAAAMSDAGDAEPATVEVIAAGTIGGRTSVGEDLGRERKTRFVAIVLGASGALAFAALVMARRGRGRRDEIEEPPSSREPEPVSESPASLGTKPATPTGAPPVAMEPPPAPAPRARGKICPTCGDRYGADAVFCGKDATQLVLIN